jgi:nucleoside-diphosphate-sugar epimerase
VTDAALTSAYRGRRALVLGASGFVGRWVARALAAAGAELHLAARDRARLDDVGERYGFRGAPWEADLEPAGAVADLVAAVRPAVTFNLAGYGVGPGERDDRLAMRLNGELVAELCAAVAEHGGPDWPGPQLVHAGSMLEYGPVAGELREDAPAHPQTPYGRAKLAGTRAVERAVADGRLRAVVARLFSVYGPGEMGGRLLPSLLAAARHGTAVELSAGLQRRDFLHVEEVAEALLRLGAAPPDGEPLVHVASGAPIPVREFVAVAARVLGLPPEQLRFGALASPWYENEVTSVARQRLAARTGWLPSRPLHEGIAGTARFLGVPMAASPAEAAGEAPVAAAAVPDLSLILAASREGARLRGFAHELARAFAAERVDLELVVVERDADEATRRAIDGVVHDRLPARRLAPQEDRGHGAAVRLGLAAARGRFVGHLCADGHVDAAATVKTYQLAAESDAGPRLAKVRRRFRLDGMARRLLSGVYNVGAAALFGGLGALDLNGSPKIFPRDQLHRLALVSDGWFLETEIVLKARRAGLQIVEINVMTHLNHAVLEPITARTAWELGVQLLAFRLGLGRVARSGRA